MLIFLISFSINILPSSKVLNSLNDTLIEFNAKKSLLLNVFKTYEGSFFLELQALTPLTYISSFDKASIKTLAFLFYKEKEII